MLGSLGDVLASCTPGKPARVATLAVRELLNGQDWRSWASLDALLPLLAEGAPDELLTALESALVARPSPVDALFAQESSGFGGHSYVSGLLWALETLAWEQTFLTRVTLALAQMAAKDPGGNRANRPFDSLVTIYLPWLPQTCAPLDKRRTALATLAKEFPDQAWRVVLELLPKGHGFTTGSHRPAWRTWIPQDRNDELSFEEYRKQVIAYTELCIQLALGHDHRLKELLAHLNELPHEAIDSVIEYLASRAKELHDEERVGFWNALEDLVSEHKRFRDAEWALPAEMLDRLDAVATQLKPRSPALVHQRLFTEKDFDLFEGTEEEDYDSQAGHLAERRMLAVSEVFGSGSPRTRADAARPHHGAVQPAWRARLGRKRRQQPREVPPEGRGDRSARLSSHRDRDSQARRQLPRVRQARGSEGIRRVDDRTSRLRFREVIVAPRACSSSSRTCGRRAAHVMVG